MVSNAGIPKLIVFAGSPLSGKSTLSKAISEDYSDSVLLEMDQTRLNELPDSEHNKADRNVAYRLTHFCADKALRKGKSTIILVATYAPPEHRRAVVELAKKWSVGIYLVECRVSPEDAVDRFWRRPVDHAGSDLTATRVRELASELPLYGGGCVVDTSKYETRECLALIRNYLNQNSPLAVPMDWVKAALETQKSVSPSQQTPAEAKISPVSRRTALVRTITYIIPFAFAGGLFAYGAFCLILAYLSESNDLFVSSSAYITAALFIFAIPPVYYFLEKPLKESLGILRLGKRPKYGPIREVRRSDRELYRDYQERTKSKSGFLINGLPIYFSIRPQLRESFDVIVYPPVKEDKNECEHFQETLRSEAAKWGFDWMAYRRWRIREKSSEYFGAEVWKHVIRATHLTSPENGVVRMEGSVAEYADYLVSEQSVNVEVPGQLPYMREFFEGAEWWSKEVDLDSLQAASRRYSMIISVTALIKTIDDFLVFQRRSAQVQSGLWGLTASASGLVEWEDVRGRTLVHEGFVPRRRNAEVQFSLRNSLFREIREELGLLEQDFKPNSRPFIAAGLNLKYGRDLNFYAYLECTLDRDRLCRVFNEGRKRNFLHLAGRDRWEISHLIFMPLQWLKNDSSESVSKRQYVLKDARHARGIVKALRVYEGWESPKLEHVRANRSIGEHNYDRSLSIYKRVGKKRKRTKNGENAWAVE